VQAHTSSEVGVLGIVLLSVYSGTTYAIFIEIGLYLTEKEQKISWHSFFLRHGVESAAKHSVLVALRRFIVIDAKLLWQHTNISLPWQYGSVVVQFE